VARSQSLNDYAQGGGWVGPLAVAYVNRKTHPEAGTLSIDIYRN